MTTTESARIAPEMMIPDLLREHPACRAVFDRYGLRGCGGASGPAESVAYFARVHGVDLDELLAGIEEAISRPDAAALRQQEPDPHADVADTIYRRFFKAGVVVILSAGAVWGALLLLRIGFLQRFTAVSIHEVNAHGHAQIFGWVGLFVMGFAYQAFPRIKHTTLWRPDLAVLSFYLMVGGIFVRALGEPLFTVPALRVLAIAATMAEIVAIALFTLILVKTFRLSGKPYERHDAYILASLGFFIVQAVYDLGMLYATTSAPSREALLGIVAMFQAPLRDLQIHGFAMLMILGVGIRMFPALFGFAAPGPRLVRRCLVLLLLGIAGESAGFMLMRGTGNHAWVPLMYGGMIMLAAGSVALTFRWGLLARPAEGDRSAKFIRAAVAWLHTSMVLLLLLPVYLRVVLPGAEALSESGSESLAIGFSHAYYGAVRHAITVGFISLTILGMAAKVVPTLSGVDVRRLPALWVPFILVNVGCFMRVAFQIGTDFHHAAYPIAGVSGLLEVTGIAIWGVHLWRIMNGRAVEAGTSARPALITADHRVGDVLQWFPETLPVFIESGFAPLANPVLRRTMAKAVSIRTAANMHRLDVPALVQKLNAATGAQRRIEGASRVSLPVLQS